MADKWKGLKKGLNIILVLFPFFAAYILITVIWNKDVTMLKPTWGDEIWWWMQADAMKSYGWPLGYFGYEGNTAPIGTYGPWGFAMIVPYAIFGKLFGWSLYSYFYANVFWLGLANLIFVVLAKPTEKEKVFLLIANAALVLNTCFSVTAMQEVSRTALGIILMSCLYFVHKEKSEKKLFLGFKYIILPILICFITQCYLVFVIFFAIYLYEVLKDRCTIWLTMAASVFGTAIMSAVSYKVLMLFVSPYIEEYNVTSILGLIKDAIIKFFDMLTGDSLFCTVYFWIYLFVCVLLFVKIAFSFLKKKTVEYEDVIAELLLLSTLGGYFALYTYASVWTIVRGLSIALAMAVYLLIKSSDKRIVTAFLIAAFVSIFSWGELKGVFLEDRFLTEERASYIASMKKELEQCMEKDLEKDTPWDYTIAVYNMPNPDVYLAIPSGFAVNSMFTEICTDARYTMVGRDGNDEYIEQLKAMAYFICYENEDIIIWERKEHE